MLRLLGAPAFLCMCSKFSAFGNFFCHMCNYFQCSWPEGFCTNKSTLSQWSLESTLPWILERGRSWPAALQHAFTVIFSLFPPNVKTQTFLDPFSVITESCFLLTCVPLPSMFEMFPGLSESLFLVTNFSSMLKKMFQQCSGSFFEL